MWCIHQQMLVMNRKMQGHIGNYHRVQPVVELASHMIEEGKSIAGPVLVW